MPDPTQAASRLTAEPTPRDNPRDVDRENAVLRELVTVYRGDTVSEEDANRLVAALHDKHPAIEFEVHEGGQEHYPYVLSLE